MDESAKRRNKGGGSKPKIGEEAQGVFLTALARGAKPEDAARAAGFLPLLGRQQRHRHQEVRQVLS